MIEVKEGIKYANIDPFTAYVIPRSRCVNAVLGIGFVARQEMPKWIWCAVAIDIGCRIGVIQVGILA